MNIVEVEQKKLIGEVIAHELAHQWFGDLVTMKWWDEIHSSIMPSVKAENINITKGF